MLRRQRRWHDLVGDPQMPYMIGRLLGANEMAVALLERETESDAAQRVAQVLGEVGAFFMEDGVRKAMLPE